MRRWIIACVAGWALTTDHVAAADDAAGAVTATIPDRVEVAGHTLDELSAMTQSPDRTTRLRGIRLAVLLGSDSRELLRRCATHDDAAMRYLACEGLGDLATDKPADADDDQPSRLDQTLLTQIVQSDPSAAVQAAAAYALVRGGDTRHLDVLIRRIQSNDLSIACGACEWIGKLGQAGVPAIETLRKVARENQPGGEGNYHIGGAANNALRGLGVTP